MERVLAPHQFNLVTHCDLNYLSRAAVLRESIGENSTQCHLFIVCHDSATLDHAIGLGIPVESLIHLNQIIQCYPVLQTAKMNRNHIEFLFCLTPFILKYFLEILKLDKIAYIDADKLVYGNPELIFLEKEEASIGITSHNFIPKLQYLNQFGQYNVGVVRAKNSDESFRVLEWWAERCIESTSIDETTSNVFGDQKYLDEFLELDSGVFVFTLRGINAAPWNCETVTSVNDKRYLNSSATELITFHFSGLQYSRHFYLAGYSRYGMRLHHSLRRNLYEKYVKKLIYVDNQLGLQKYKSFSLRKIVRGVLFRDFGVVIANPKKNS